MDHYVVEVELCRRQLTDDDIDAIVEDLSDVAGVVTAVPGGGPALMMTLPADGLRAAVATGLALACQHGEPLSVSAVPEAVRDARQGWEPVPELLGVTDAAVRLGVSRQRVLQMIDEGKLPATRAGNSWVIPAAAVRGAPS